jgi:hypothetical protein
VWRDLATFARTRRWSFDEGDGPVVHGDLFLLQTTVQEMLAKRVPRLAAVVAAGFAGALLTYPDSWRTDGFGVARVVVCLAAIMGARLWSTAPLAGPNYPAWLTLNMTVLAPLHVLTSAVLVIWLGPEVIEAAGYGVIIGFAANLLAGRLRRFRTAPVRLSARLALSMRLRRGAAAWSAAAAARSVRRTSAAARLWTDLVNDSATDQRIRMLSEIMLAELALDCGGLQTAVELAEKALRTRSRLRASRFGQGGLAGAQTAVLAAEVLLTAGDAGAAATLLDSAGLPMRVQRHPAVVSLRARVLVEAGRADEAWRELTRIRFRRMGAQVADMLDAVTGVAASTWKATPDRAIGSLRGAVQMGVTAACEDAATPADARALDQRIAVARLLLGQILLRTGEAADAEQELQRARRGFAPAAEPIRRAIANLLFGCALAARRPGPDALAPMEDGLRALEAARVTLRRQGHRGGLARQLEEVYAQALDTLAELSVAHSGAGKAAAVLVESLRADALATTLRAGRVGDPRFAAALRRVESFEQRLLDGGAGGGSEPAGSASPESATAGSELAGAESAELTGLRGTLAALRSATYADAYLPEPVSFADLRRRAGGAHILSFRLALESDAGVRGHVVWIPPGQAPRVTRVAVGSPAALALLGLGDDEQTEKLHRSLARGSLLPGRSPIEPLRELATGLLPAALRAQLGRTRTDEPIRLLVVPEGPLMAAPWAGLLLDDGRFLVDVAIIQVLPSIGLLGLRGDGSPRATHPDGDRPRVLLHRDGQADSGDLAPIGDRGIVSEVPRRRELSERLAAAGAFDGAYFSVHGGDRPHGHELVLGDGGALSADAAEALHWPEWVVFSSCVVGRLGTEVGHEPKGLATSCLLGGASTIVAGVAEVAALSADKIGAAVAVALMDRRQPAAALRAAQLALITGWRTASLHRWAYFVCISTDALAESTPLLTDVQEQAV